MDEIALLARERMEKTEISLQNNLNTLRTGRASPSLLDRIEVDYYGEKIALNQIAGITVPEPRQLLVKPYDKNDVKSIVSALAASDLGINPINEGDSVRLILPPLTHERRQDLAKQAKRFADEAKVAIRNIRHEHVSLITDDEYSEDLKKRILNDIQKVTDEAIEKIDNIYKEKEQEILTI
jgi:ribosome recycling factor